MTPDALTIPVDRLSRLEEPWSQPLAIVRLHESVHGDLADADWQAPPCPVIGLGALDHPLAGLMDCMLEPPFALEALVTNVLAQPAAASTLVQVLRTTGDLPPEDALTVESMAYAMLQGSAGHASWYAGRPRGSAASPGEIRVARDHDVLEITLCRAATGNAIDRTMRDGLANALRLAAIDHTIDRVRLCGQGKAFSLGADLDEFGTTTDPAEAHTIRRLTLPARGAIAVADRLEAHVDGACVGAGLELAAFAARMTATRRSWFQLPELAMGIIPGAGGCVSLPRRIGRQRTALMVLSGRRISARRALAWGLVDALVDDPPGGDRGDDIV